MHKLFILVSLFVGLALCARAQQPDTLKVKNRTDSLNRKQDSITSKPFVPRASKKIRQYHPDSTHSPGLAFRRSGYIPGWGQLYNHKWWKVPIIYTGIGLLGSAIIFNQTNYHHYLKLYNIARKGTGESSGNDTQSADYLEYESLSKNGVTETQLQTAVVGYQRNFQLSILGLMGAWGIQMIDAYIDAKFIHSYSMDNNLSFKVTPGIAPQLTYAANYNVSLMPVIKLSILIK
ncbi:hypothetical protein HH214_02160 [Mucilaginibacter robiniae]|uniref:DUF5683 domain-containing protein n=1 Tax=Mucilaginibacter robiniae TaxID=2728022 RepID=A0A7L5DUM9_9SPHI|nr:DUF5683 domain-containing protein [Mucilaginibacter robiniae]QJD94762.1 hypothetical protein HH214_02160 [Mucilaginibacter robiniae]